MELGAGAGVITRAPLADGIPAARVAVVEVVPDMTDHLRATPPARKHGLMARREAWTPLNPPPASVWRYTPA